MIRSLTNSRPHTQGSRPVQHPRSPSPSPRKSIHSSRLHRRLALVNSAPSPRPQDQLPQCPRLSELDRLDHLLFGGGACQSTPILTLIPPWTPSETDNERICRYSNRFLSRIHHPINGNRFLKLIT